jgi:hypothetical protein
MLYEHLLPSASQEVMMNTYDTDCLKFDVFRGSHMKGNRFMHHVWVINYSTV